MNFCIVSLLGNEAGEEEMKKYWEGEENWRGKEVYLREYRLGFLPGGEFEKIICKINCDESWIGLHSWKNGVLFANSQNVSGLIYLENEGIKRNLIRLILKVPSKFEEEERVDLLINIVEKIESLLSFFYDMPSPLFNLQAPPNATITRSYSNSLLSTSSTVLSPRKEEILVYYPCNICFDFHNWEESLHAFSYNYLVENHLSTLVCDKKESRMNLSQLAPDLKFKFSKVSFSLFNPNNPLKKNNFSAAFINASSSQSLNKEAKEKVAIKSIEIGENVKRFSEMRHFLFLYSNLTHGNLVQFFGALYEPPNYIEINSQSLLSSHSLHQLLQENKKLKSSLKFKLKVGHEITTALQFLHSQNPPIAHLFVNPHHVMIESLDLGYQKCSVKLLQPSFPSLIRYHTRRIFSPTFSDWPYFSPEMLNHEYCDHLSDIYSFGILLYQIFSLKKPFHDLFLSLTSPVLSKKSQKIENEKEEEEDLQKNETLQVYKKIRYILFQNLRPVCDVNWPTLVQEIIESCLQSNPDLRMTSLSISRKLRTLLNPFSQTPFSSALDLISPRLSSSSTNTLAKSTLSNSPSSQLNIASPPLPSFNASRRGSNVSNLPKKNTFFNKSITNLNNDFFSPNEHFQMISRYQKYSNNNQLYISSSVPVYTPKRFNQSASDSEQNNSSFDSPSNSPSNSPPTTPHSAQGTLHNSPPSPGTFKISRNIGYVDDLSFTLRGNTSRLLYLQKSEIYKKKKTKKRMKTLHQDYSPPPITRKQNYSPPPSPPRDSPHRINLFSTPQHSKTRSLSDKENSLLSSIIPKKKSTLNSIFDSPSSSPPSSPQSDITSHIHIVPQHLSPTIFEEEPLEDLEKDMEEDVEEEEETDSPSVAHFSLKPQRILPIKENDTNIEQISPTFIQYNEISLNKIRELEKQPPKVLFKFLSSVPETQRVKILLQINEVRRDKNKEKNSSEDQNSPTFSHIEDN